MQITIPYLDREIFGTAHVDIYASNIFLPAHTGKQELVRHQQGN